MVKKKKSLFIFMVIICLLLLTMFSACNNARIKVMFDSNGGSKVDAIETDGESSIKLPPKPQRDGYIFRGWFYDNEAFRNHFDAKSLIDMPITSNLTVYAKWVEILVGTEGLVYETNEDGYKVVGYTGSDERVVVPAVYDGVIVTEIADVAFENNENITSIFVSETINEIGEGAFKGCINLEEISLPFIGKNRNVNATIDGVFGHIFGYTMKFDLNTVTVQQYYSSKDFRFFYIPQKLTKVTITDADYIPYGAFHGCAFITNISLPQSIYGIGANAFNSCKDLRMIIIPKGAINIGADAFKNCSSLTIYSERATPPTGWRSAWNPNDLMIYWGVNKNEVGEHNGFQYFAEFNKISITRYSAPNDEITIPTSIEGKPVDAIKDMAFSNNNTITSVTIPQSINNIGFGVFINCKKLRTISLPFLGDKAINGEYQHLGYNFGTNNSSSNKEFVETRLKEVNIGGGTEISDSAFYDCDMIETITISNTVTKISNSAFRNCSSLMDMDLPSGIKTIGEYAFASCTSATSINVPNGVTSIGKYAFYNCVLLEQIAIPKGVTAIEEYTYNKCSGLTQIFLPKTLISIKEYAFAGCSGASEIIISHGIETIGNRAFEGNSNVSSIIIPNSITEMGDWVFENCKKMIYIYLPNSINGLGTQAFKGCDNLFIYAQLSARPSGWKDQWSFGVKGVVWGASPPE